MEKIAIYFHGNACLDMLSLIWKLKNYYVCSKKNSILPYIQSSKNQASPKNASFYKQLNVGEVQKRGEKQKSEVVDRKVRLF